MDEEEMTQEENEEGIEFVPDEEGALPDIQKKVKKVKEDLKKCETERKEYLEGWQRAKADHINYKNDEGTRMEAMERFIAAGHVTDVLPALDSFDLALGHAMPQEVERGVLLIRSQFEDVLKKRGLTEIEVKVGDEFNPEKHESIGEVESGAAAGAIAEVVQRGYFFRERVLRPARVRLSKG